MPDALTAAVIRRDVAEIAAASYLASLGIAALALYVLRRRSADATPLSFAGFALLYATRLAATTDTVPLIVGGDERAWAYGRAALTYALVVASVYFAEALLGAGWRGLLRRLRVVGLIFTPVAIAGMFVTREPEWIMRVNNLLILAFVAALAMTTRARHVERAASLPVVRVGLMVAVAFVIAENLRAVGVLRWPVRLEFIGMLAFLSSLAFAVADRFLRTEGRLAAVDRELATARRIQQAILPQAVPASDRFRLHVRYVPMTEVAGDFYDFLDVAGPRGTILVADVSGHGVPAALIASMVKIAAASQSDHGADPGGLLSGLSRTLQDQLGGQFLTAIALHVDGARKEVAWSGAGHPPILHWQASPGRIATLASDGILIGMVPSTYTTQRAPVAAGDRLILYTDGVLEAVNPAGEFFGDRRFGEVIAGHAGRPGSELATAVIDEMTRWGRGGRFDDDVTLIVVDLL